jgi:hypothetical protein
MAPASLAAWLFAYEFIFFQLNRLKYIFRAK